MDPHASGEVAKQFMILRLGTQDLDPESSVWERFFHKSNEFNNILRHKRKEGEMTAKSRGILPSEKNVSKPIPWIYDKNTYFVLINL